MLGVKMCQFKQFIKFLQIVNSFCVKAGSQTLNSGVTYSFVAMDTVM